MRLIGFEILRPIVNTFCQEVGKYLPNSSIFCVQSPVSSIQVSLDPEVMVEFQVFQDRVLMERGERMVPQEYLGGRASLETSWEPHLEGRDRMVFLEYLETRDNPGHLEDRDCLVGLETYIF